MFSAAAELVPPAAATAEPLLRVEALEKHFRAGGGAFAASRVIHAVNGVDLTVASGEIVAVVGESGSGKSTLGRCILGLTRPSAGRILFEGADLSALRGQQLRRFRLRVQPIFQDAFGSLDPRWSVERTIREPLDANGVGSPAERRQRVAELLGAVGLTEAQGRSRPLQLSGGQRQRAGIAAALAVNPHLIVADEPVSALDVLVQAQILNLIADVQRERRLAILVITHDLAVVEHIADRVAVMYLGRIVESGPTAELLARPRHPYTRALIDAIPHPDPANRSTSATRGEISSAIDLPSGCHFHPRCPRALEICSRVAPRQTSFGLAHMAACHNPVPLND